MTMVVLVPSRGRPHNIKRLADAWITTGAEAHLQVGVDDDDDVDAYCEALLDVGQAGVTVLPRTTMNGTLNAMAAEAAEHYEAIGFCGDDHLPRTLRWDETITDKMELTPFVYANDLMQGPLLPTAIFMRSSVVTALGYMAPSVLKHLYLDNSWLEWGKAVGITYIPEVVIEHLHPHAGKAENDGGYDRVNGSEMYDHDRTAFDAYVADGGLQADLDKLHAI